MAKVFHHNELVACGNFNPADLPKLSEQINHALESLRLVYTEEEQISKRKRAYVAESDPLYLQWQYDKTPESEQVWRDKVEEIKARYPLPDNTPTK